MAPTPPTAAQLPFAALLQQQRKGLLHAELSDQLQQLVAGVMTHGKTGTLTLKITVKPEGDEAVTIADSYSTKIPTPPAKPSIFFADDTGQISRARLNQPELPLQGLVGGAAAETNRGGEETAFTS